MAIALLFCTIFWLYLRAASATNGLPDTFVPSTGGYLCGTIIFDIKFLEEEAGRAFKKFTHQSIQKDFPALFEDSYLFGRLNEVLLAWPLSYPGVPLKQRLHGNYRLIIDSNSEVIGVVTVIYPEKMLDQKEFRRCTPIHSLKDGEGKNAIQYTENLDRIFRFMGYSCNGEFIEERAYTKTLESIRAPNLKSKNPIRPKKFIEYGNKRFIGDNLFSFPLRHLDRNDKLNGPLNTHQIIFQRDIYSNILVKGVLSKGSRGKKCSRLWDLSPLFEIIPDVSSPISREKALVNNDGTFTCTGQVINISTVLLQVPLGLIQAQKTIKPSDEKYPILQDRSLWLWPIRLPESITWSEYVPYYLISYANITILDLEYLFAIGYSLEFQVVGLFFAHNDHQKNPNFFNCGNS
ncbi:putative candidate secreted effector protein [Blumeria hordei DH14]|uniref:Putative candidate secreted effector protein n=1 Tax=Blumeria graminis f. sp. hordei (strain DH14) TaxID=546991 RepID=N1JG18_BLUG1|nr:putative candidate secreted effector protein [Blumeria hordei DH14]